MIEIPDPLPLLDKLQPATWPQRVPMSGDSILVDYFGPTPEMLRPLTVEVGDDIITVKRTEGGPINVELMICNPVNHRVLDRLPLLEKPVELIALRSIDRSVHRWGAVDLEIIKEREHVLAEFADILAISLMNKQNRANKSSSVD